ncbi:MAG TPA: methylamine dehydrogenase light chain [Rubrivivax sp.]|nr:amine dehydrogenase [Pseudomonadota bacterium]HPP83472.1 methylamine dehydrogenase light chain [Rubrivivax sp.]
MKWFDDLFERTSRRAAQRVSRRGAVVGVGRLLVGAAFTLPVLPFDRIARAAEGGKKKEPGAQDCDYWRYCGVDGFLCSCCGGTMSTCPPGTEPSKVAWVGTCHNPKDGKDYLISYNDCCGKTACGRCVCNTNIGERPGYRMGLHNDINWCLANSSSTMFHCTTSLVVGLAEKGS